MIYTKVQKVRIPLVLEVRQMQLETDWKPAFLPMGGFHSQKAQEYSNALNKWLKKNPNASDYDKMVARSLL